MTAGNWLLWLALSGAAAAISLWHYHRRETPGRGRTLLAGLRTAAVALVLLLLFEPELPAGVTTSNRGTQVLLDASLSMNLPDASSGAGSATRWAQAAQRARARAGERPVLLFGDAVRPVPGATLPDSAPGDGRSRLLPALQAAAEAGVRRVVVITDGGIEDADAVARWAPRLGLTIETEVVGDVVANRSLLEASGPAWVEAGGAAVFEFGVTGATSDSVRVVARRGGRVIGRATVSGAAEGRIATGRIETRLDPPPGGGWVAIELALEGGDAVPDDDLRTVYVQVSDEPAGIALVSLRPDWEPRFLAPVLEQALGLPLRAYLRGASGQYVRLAGGLQAGQPATEEEVSGAIRRGEIVVLHGFGTDAPQWAVDAASSAARVMIFPADATSAGLTLPASVGAEQTGDFYASVSVPPSPVAALLADIELNAISPLSALRLAEVPDGAWAPLLVTRGRQQGAALPLALAGQEAGRRWVIALGSGYWQWSFRGGSERQAYVRLWSALAGWLAQERGTASLAAVRPAQLALPRGLPVPWIVSDAADSIALTITGSAEAAVIDTVIAGARADTVYSAAPPPGDYSYRARAFAGDSAVEAEGIFTIERYTPELARPRVEAAAMSAVGTPVRGDDERAAGTPLHTTPWPFVLLVVLLAGEWVLRRRWGLR